MSVADELRAQRARDLLRLGADDRIALALRLGDDDVFVLSAVRGIPESEARLVIERSRQLGRRRSRCASR